MAHFNKTLNRNRSVFAGLCVCAPDVLAILNDINNVCSVIILFKDKTLFYLNNAAAVGYKRIHSYKLIVSCVAGLSSSSSSSSSASCLSMSLFPSCYETAAVLVNYFGVSLSDV